MNEMKIIIALVALFVRVSAQAHERFIADVEFDNWARHCHTSVRKYLEAGEEKKQFTEYCWAIYQKKYDDIDDYESGIVILVDEQLSRPWIEVRSINLFGRGFTIQIDENEAIDFVCHSDFCDPDGRDYAEVIKLQEKVIDQFIDGKVLFLREEQIGNNAKGLELRISLDGFDSAISP